MKKLAFCFLIDDTIHEEVWNSFFKNVDKQKYTIYIHSTSNIPLKYFEQYTLSNCIQTNYKDSTRVLAYNALFRQAYLDTENYKFIILSGSCMPFKSFDHIYKELTNDSFGYFQVRPASQVFPHCNSMLSFVKKDDIQKSSQWFVLNRILVETLCFDKDELLQIILKHVVHPVEYYYYTYICIQNLQNEITTTSNRFHDASTDVGCTYEPNKYDSIEKEELVYLLKSACLFGRTFHASCLMIEEYLNAIVTKEASNPFYVKYVQSFNIRPETNKKILSYCLYSANGSFCEARKFYKGIFVNYHLAKTIYPEYIVRIYMPHTEPPHIIEELSSFQDIELILVDTNICLRALRFLPYDDENVEIWLSRDLDSIVNERERAAVDDWLQNYAEKELHIMSDHPQHYWKIAGGLFGFKQRERNGSFADFVCKFSQERTNNNEYAIDCLIAEQFFYNDSNYIQHYRSGKQLQHSKPFPKHANIRIEHVGSIEDIQFHFHTLQILKHYPVFDNPSLLYWKNVGNYCKNYTSNDDYLILNPCMGGIDDARMSFEVGAAIAYRLNRILVIPDTVQIDQFEHIQTLESIFDFEDLGIPSMKVSEFCMKKGIANTWEEIKKISTVYTFRPEEYFINLDGSKPLHFSPMDSRKEILLDNRASVIFFDRNLFGNFSAVLHDSSMDQIKKYVYQNIHFHERFFRQAYRVIHFLTHTYTRYFSLHIRRKDFEKYVCPGLDTIFNNIKSFVPKGSCIYVSTDMNQPTDLDCFRSYYKIVVLSDIEHLLPLHRNPDLFGILEQIICTRSELFVGSPFSTFSTYIYRLRGYMVDIQDKSYYLNTIHTKIGKNDMKTCWASNDMVWGREFEDSFDIPLKGFTIENGDEFYYQPWNTKCIASWYSDSDFILKPVRTNTSTSSQESCFKTENGNGKKLLQSNSSILVNWEDNEKRQAYISNKDTISILFKEGLYHFTRIV